MPHPCSSSPVPPCDAAVGGAPHRWWDALPHGSSRRGGLPAGSGHVNGFARVRISSTERDRRGARGNVQLSSCSISLARERDRSRRNDRAAPSLRLRSSTRWPSCCSTRTGRGLASRGSGPLPSAERTTRGCSPPRDAHEASPTWAQRRGCGERWTSSGAGRTSQSRRLEVRALRTTCRLRAAGAHPSLSSSPAAPPSVATSKPQFFAKKLTCGSRSTSAAACSRMRRARGVVCAVPRAGSITAGQGAVDGHGWSQWLENFLTDLHGNLVTGSNGAFPGTISAYMSVWCALRWTWGGKVEGGAAVGGGASRPVHERVVSAVLGVGWTGERVAGGSTR